MRLLLVDEEGDAGQLLAGRAGLRPGRRDPRSRAAAAGLVLQEAGGRMEYLRLIKLLGLADRESWREVNRPITGDDYVAMKCGPVASRTFDLVKTEPEEGPWARTIKREGRFTFG